MATKFVCPKCKGDIIDCPDTLDPVRCEKCKAVILRKDLKEIKI